MYLLAQIKLLKVVAAVCTTYNEPEYKVWNRSREPMSVTLRMMIAYFARHYTNASLKQIGRFMQKDHSTIIHYIKKASDRIDIYESWYSKAEQIEEALQSIGMVQLRDVPNRNRAQQVIDDNDDEYQQMLEQAIAERKAKPPKEKPKRIPLFGDAFAR